MIYRYLKTMIWCLLINSGLSQMHAEVKLAALFSDNMVLQQSQPVPVWGWASPGESVVVAFAGQEQSAVADATGKWLVQLRPLTANKQGTSLQVRSKSGTITLNNVLVGEVWLCSGQSNMEMGVGSFNDAEKEIAAAYHPAIRLFNPANNYSDTPLSDVAGDAHWQVCTPQTIATGGWGGFSATGYYFGRELLQELDVPIGLIDASWSATAIEPWIAPEGFATEPLLQSIYDNRMEKPAVGIWGEPSRPSSLFNAMIHPLLPVALRGVIWYQGESNVGDGMLYFTKMKALINGWRKLLNQPDLPFYFAQIAPYKDYPENDLPELWAAQIATLALPNTAMAVTMDIGELDDIHPKNKQDVGKRLALCALAKTYGKPVEYSGPVFRSMQVAAGKIVLSFDHVGDGLSSRDNRPLAFFTIAEADGKFVPATAEISGKTVIVSSPQTPNPVHVRFGWSRFAQPNLVNSAGLPALPFRTDR